MQFKRFYLFITGLFLITSCAKEQLYPEQECDLESVYLYGNYTYYIGEDPTFTINTSLTSQYLSYGNVSINPNFSQNGENRVKISIADITVQKGAKNYNIDTDILAEEFKNGSWSTQSEFNNIIEPQQKNMAIVLVLDMSTSLGNDIAQVKNAALNFAQDFLSKTDQQGKIGLVLFAQDIDTLDFTSNYSTISSFINSYNKAQNSTTLYGAIDKGLNMLENLTLQVDGKALIGFTDGGDNNTTSPTTVKNNIQNSSTPRYMIGLYGKSQDYSEEVLRSLASDESKFANAANSAELSVKFNEILDQITNIIHLQYLRTQQQFDVNLDAPIEIRFKFKLN